jgi:4-nitrophenyl phosphatase
MDRSMTYDRLAIATRLIRAGVPFIGTNPDRTIPSALGLMPGAGTTLAALRASTDVDPVVIGKPEPAIFQSAVRRLGANPATTAMIGDRLETDILGAQRIGIGSIGVLTGVMTRQSIAESEYKPDKVFDSIAELAEELGR